MCLKGFLSTATFHNALDPLYFPHCQAATEMIFKALGPFLTSSEFGALAMLEALASDQEVCWFTLYTERLVSRSPSAALNK